MNRMVDIEAPIIGYWHSETNKAVLSKNLKENAVYMIRIQDNDNDVSHVTFIDTTTNEAYGHFIDLYSEQDGIIWYRNEPNAVVTLLIPSNLSDGTKFVAIKMPF